MPDANATEPRPALLDPVDRISEILFGLIMAATILGTLSVVHGGRQDVRTALYAALGCNLAWGLVDGVMYLVRTMIGRSHQQHRLHQLQSAPAAQGVSLLRQWLPGPLESVVENAELETLRRKLIDMRLPDRSALRPADYAAALAIFILVALSTLPLALPYVFMSDILQANIASRIITLVMLFLCGRGFAYYAGHPHPTRIGLAMMALGVALIAIVVALGG